MTMTTVRSICEIADEIWKDWRKDPQGICFGAEPYLSAMGGLDKVTEKFGCESAKSIILYFLCNARTWKGPVARRIKKELQEMCK